MHRPVPVRFNLAVRSRRAAEPLAHGIGPPIDGQPAWYVICQAPPGPPVTNGPRPWPEQRIIDFVLRPIAAVLDQLQIARHHPPCDPSQQRLPGPRAIARSRSARHWSAPPAMHQPAVCETAYTALCHPAARGDGRIADDVYALGVLLMTLALGRLPMEGVDDRDNHVSQARTRRLRRDHGRRTPAADPVRPGARHARRGPGPSAESVRCCAIRAAPAAGESPPARRLERNGHSKLAR